MVCEYPLSQQGKPCCAEVLTARVLYCLLTLLDAAIKMTVAATQVFFQI
jgi:hypothetical protein